MKLHKLTKIYYTQYNKQILEQSEGADNVFFLCILQKYPLKNGCRKDWNHLGQQYIAQPEQNILENFLRIVIRIAFMFKLHVINYKKPHIIQLKFLIT